MLKRQEEMKKEKKKKRMQMLRGERKIREVENYIDRMQNSKGK